MYSRKKDAVDRPGFEYLEPRLLLNSAPLALADAYSVNEDETLDALGIPASIHIDADSFADEEVISDAFPGVTLRAEETPGTGLLLSEDILAQENSLASTGTNVFGHTVVSYWPLEHRYTFESDKHEWGDGYQNWLRAEFAGGAVLVSLDFIANNQYAPYDDNPVLRAFNSTGFEVAMATADGSFNREDVVTLTVEAADIAYVKAEADLGGNSAWFLDNLVYEAGSGGGVLDNDSDADGDTLTAELVAGPTHAASFTLNSNGTFTYTPEAGYNGTDSFTYWAYDDDELYSDPATVTITVNPVNDAPVVTVPGPVSTNEDTSVAVAGVSVSDVDVSEPEGTGVMQLSLSAEHGDLTLVDTTDLTFVDGANGTHLMKFEGLLANVNAALATLSYQGDQDYNGPDSITVTANDLGNTGAGGALSDTEIVPVTVNNLVDLSGRVFEDRDNDGVFDPSDGDAGIEGVTLNLIDQTTGEFIDTQTTDEQGGYIFDANLGAGVYKIVETQPEGYLDGKQDFNEIAGIIAGEPGTTDDGVGYDFAELLPASLQGLVWEDFNDDGGVNRGELVIENVQIQITGTDDRGDAVDVLQATNDQGIFEFVDLRPGEYEITETQPADFIDGQDVLGEVIEAAPGVVTGDDGYVDLVGDKFSGIGLVAGSSGVNYNFGERIESGQVHEGQTAMVGFWQNKHGQNLIMSLNGGPGSTLLGDWLAVTFPNMYGGLAGMAGMTNVEVADVFKQLFKRNGKTSPGGPPKLDAKVMGLALSVYVTKESLVSVNYETGPDPSLVAEAESYGFEVTAGGAGSTYFNIGDSSEAFYDYSDGQDVQIIDLLLATDRMSLDGLLYDDADTDGNGDGQIDDYETYLRTLAHDVYSAICEQGTI